MHIAYFNTFTTTEGHTISITDTHYIVAVTDDDRQIQLIRALDVTLDHRLIMLNRTIALKKIVYSVRVGYYSPITLSGYLLVNNLSTSVYVKS